MGQSFQGTDPEKLERILRLCEGMANRLVEHDAELKFIRAQVDINTEDDSVMAGKIRKLENMVTETKDSVNDLTFALEQQKRKSIHDLQAAEERRSTGGE